MKMSKIPELPPAVDQKDVRSDFQPSTWETICSSHDIIKYHLWPLVGDKDSIRISLTNKRSFNKNIRLDSLTGGEGPNHSISLRDTSIASFSLTSSDLLLYPLKKLVIYKDRVRENPSEYIFKRTICVKTVETVIKWNSLIIDRFIDVSDYEADKTGVEDCYNSFNHAMIAAVSLINPCFKVYIPPGIYNLGKTVILPGQIEIFGNKDWYNGTDGIKKRADLWLISSTQTTIICKNSAFSFSGLTKGGQSPFGFYIHNLVILAGNEEIELALNFHVDSATSESDINVSQNINQSRLRIENVDFGSVNNGSYFASCMKISGETDVSVRYCYMWNKKFLTGGRNPISLNSLKGGCDISQCTFATD